MNVILTAHAVTRIRQRGFREDDVAMVLRYGSRMNDGTLMITDQDVRREVEALRRHKTRLERLRGMTAVVEGSHVVTVYKDTRCSRHRQFEAGER